MTTPFVDQDIRSDEGFEPKAYPDPITNADPWTIGFGSTGEGIGPGVVWTLAQAVRAQVARRQEIETALDQAISWWRSMNDARQDVLVNMAYNVGVRGLLQFHTALADMERADYAGAATELLNSVWAKQVSRRANRLAAQMRSGVRAASAKTAVAPASNIVPPDPMAQSRAATGEV